MTEILDTGSVNRMLSAGGAREELSLRIDSSTTGPIGSPRDDGDRSRYTAASDPNQAVSASVDEIPDDELEAHYAKAISELDEHDISMLAAWHASMEVGTPIPNRDYLMGAFPSLGVHRREALKLAAGFRGEEAVDRGVTEERALETVLEWLSGPRLMQLALEATELYIWDRAGSDN